jgi:hypothetical protein
MGCIMTGCCGISTLLHLHRAGLHHHHLRSDNHHRLGFHPEAAAELGVARAARAAKAAARDEKRCEHPSTAAQSM